MPLVVPPRNCLRRLLTALVLLAATLPAMAGRFSRVIIDAGHGGHDNGGKIGYIFEKHLALDVALRLERYLSDKGIRSTLTRQRDVFIPLEDRAAAANASRNSIFVSIHFNWVSYGGPSGTETFYCGSSGVPLAAAIQSTVAAGLGTPSRGVKYARYKVLRSCSQPAALIEGGFISTANERSRILDPRYRQRLAELIGNGILRYRRM
ncbi:MAG TPA: N-acetylmuramoyl-L-alanine amidase [Verrucomicrobiales bacterium]|jgi:N-acetylmuramoyl-L-alanine amidase|nr:N-acetylmuramoyl-L-alanine amidase [Verrucomicrobiales bacterium]